MFEHHLYNSASYKQKQLISQSLLFQDAIYKRFKYCSSYLVTAFQPYMNMCVSACVHLCVRAFVQYIRNFLCFNFV